MDYTQSGSDILLKQPDFGLDDTLDCGQAFRWEIKKLTAELSLTTNLP